MKFSGYLMFIGLWSILVYAPVAHWEWGGGFLGASGVGALDFAGGAVVHANAGAAALATAIYLGRRRGHGSDDMSPHNVPFVILGAGILWFGWFGFNAGSALTSGALASSAFVEHPARRRRRGCWRGSSSSGCGRAGPRRSAPPPGAVAGLATITPAAGFVQPMAALVIGLAAGIVCFLAVGLKGRFGYDDSLDVVGVHMVGGIIGVLLTGVFASLAVNAAGAAASLAQRGEAGGARRRDRRLLVRGDPGHPEGHGPHGGAAGLRRARGRGPRRVAARRGRVPVLKGCLALA